MQKGDPALIKKMNQQLVLRLIQSRGPVARRDIARMSGLSPASVTGITGELIELGLVQEAGEVERKERAGRRAIQLRLNPKAGYVVGVSMAMHKFTCVLTDLDANILYSNVHDLIRNDASESPYSPDKIIQSMIQAIERLLNQTQINTEYLMGIGIGINGIVNYKTGESLFAPHYRWFNIPLAAPIASHFNIPVHLENDARTLTIAEQLFGAGRDVDNFVAIAIGYGIGAGIVANSQIYRGAYGGAGEFGHVILQPGGPPCVCGKRGCLEALASVPAIMRQIEKAINDGEQSTLAGQNPLTIEAIAAAADEGDPVAVRIVTEAGRWLGQGMAMLVNVLNPELFIINGEAVCLGPHYLDSMETVMREYAFDGLADSFRIVTDPGGSEIWAQGVASVVLSSLFTSDDNDQLL
jgi:predicted NBD/HSP70 family sugar kinase